MLVLWTQDTPKHLKKTVGEVIQRQPVPHRVEPLGDGLPVCEVGDIVLAMGNEAREILQAAGLIPKNRTIGSLRCALIPLPVGHALLTYSAGIIDLDYELAVALQTDAILAVRYTLTGSLAPTLGSYRYVSDFSEAVKVIAQYCEEQTGLVPIALDTETLGLDCHAPDGYIVSIQLTHHAGQADMVRFACKEEEEAALRGPLREQLDWLMNHPRLYLRGANFKYDANWFWQRAKLRSSNFRFDTTLVGSLLDENRSNSLNVHTKLYVPALGGYDDPLNQKYDKARMDLIPPEDLLPYACGDTDACYQVAEAERTELVKDNTLANFYLKIVHPGARAFERIEQTGWCVDPTYYRFLQEELEDEIQGLERQAKEILGGRLFARHHKEGVLNLQKASLLQDFMFSPSGLNLKPKMLTEKNKVPSTAMEHLLMFKDEPKAADFVTLLKQYASATKTHDTYVVGFLKHLRSDGRFHPTAFLFSGEAFDQEGGTITGRRSFKDPALQTLPKHTKWAKRLRKAFIAPPGYLILSCDFSQGELRIAACLSHEEVMLEAYRQGIDLHALTASQLAGYEFVAFMALKESDPDLFEFLRQLAKAANFGLCIAEGQRVLTDQGLVPIEKVTCQHKVWDGVEWVSHQGVVFKGYKEVITYEGLTATKDHEVWTQEGERISLGRAASEIRPLVVTGRETTPVVFRSILDPELQKYDSKERLQRWELQLRKSTVDHSIRESEKQVRVFDLLNAGPRHRFTCEGKLVSNCYGMGAEGFVAYALSNYGVIMTLDEGAERRGRFFSTYPGLLPWHEEQRAFARRHGYVRSPLGRIRHLPLIHSPRREVQAKEERRAINSPVQGTLGDFSLWAAAIWHQMGMFDTAPIFGEVHDQLLTYVPEDNYEAIAQRQVQVMENLPFGQVDWQPQVPFLVDAQIGPDLADLKKLAIAR